PISREGSLVLNNILLCSICAVVVTGTMYPPFMQLLAGRTISVGKPFFDAATIPLTLPLLLAMGVGTALPWKRAQLARTFSHLYAAAGIAAIGLVLCFWKLSGVLPIACGALAIWVIAASASDVLRRIGIGHTSAQGVWERMKHLPRSSWGAALAHIGAGITVLGLCGMSQAQHAIVEVHIGETRSLAGDDWTLLDVHDYIGPNYKAMQADIAIRHNGKLVTILHPEKRDFTTQSQTTTEVAIHTNFITDLYGVVGDRHGTGKDTTYVLRLHRNPLAPWMWLGGLVMAIGGAFSLSDRRMRIGAPKRAAARNMARA
ncbi:MAG: cytochrome c-type biogenesis CcmF C-terminal domain-containing protein, partial [Gluconobacter oxydans]